MIPRRHPTGEGCCVLLIAAIVPFAALIASAVTR
jgi:hypothetical protein